MLRHRAAYTRNLQKIANFYDRGDCMSKPLSLLFAVTAVLLMIGTSIALSYQIPWLILTLFGFTLVVIVAGFVVKSRFRK